MIKIVPDKGNMRTEIRLKRTDDDFNRGIELGLYQLGAKLKVDAKNKIANEPKTGRVYRRRGGRRHRASSPGEAPANETGNLLNSVDYDIIGGNRMEFGYKDSAPYGRFLEDGTIRIKKRPNIRPTVLENDRNAESMIANNIRRRIKS